MKRIRRSVVRALDSVGLKRPLKTGLNRVLAAGGLPPIGEPKVFRDLERLVRGPRPRPAASRGRLLFFTMRGWTTHVALETLLGEAAAQRGVEPLFFTCGGPLPLCGITNFRAPDPTPCADCYGYVGRYFETLGFGSSTLGDFVDGEDRRRAAATVAALGDDELEAFEHDGLPLGRMVRTSVLWFLLRGTPTRDERWHRTMRDFLSAALLLKTASARLLDRARPDRILCLNGLFFAERVLLATAEASGVPWTTYERGFMPQTWVFRHAGIACDYPIGADFRRLGDRPLDRHESRRLDRYLEGRTRGGVDAAQYWPRIEERRAAVVDDLGLDPRKPIVSAFTNIVWDSAVLDHDVAFDHMFDWLARSVQAFASRDDAQLIIRVHPAEVRLAGQETDEGVRESLVERLGGLPPNVRVVSADSGLSSYTLGGMSRFVIVYTSTIGLEFAAAGLPVVVAGDTHYRGLGFTIDVDDREGYRALLDRLLSEAPPAADAERARRYAHFFFFRFMVPLGITREDADRNVRIPLDSLAELGPGRDPVLDTVMNGLIEGRPIFVEPGQPVP